MHFNDHYQSLGLPPGADAASIKRAYRRLARRHHPDVNSAQGAEAAMARLNEAYQVLSDPKLRAAYDAVRLSQVNQTSQPQAATPSSSSFQQGFGFAQASTEARPERGIDAHARLVIDLADAYAGAQRDITLQPPGMEPRLLKVALPRGVQEGQVLRLLGQGGPGQDGGEPGDLLLEIAFLPDGPFSADGLDVSGILPLAPWEAALGAEIEVRTPPGQLVRVQVPPDSPQGRQLRLSGLGIPGATAGDLSGDLLLTLQIVLPSSDDPKTRALWQVMAQALPDFNPREPLPPAGD